MSSPQELKVAFPTDRRRSWPQPGRRHDILQWRTGTDDSATTAPVKRIFCVIFTISAALIGWFDGFVRQVDGGAPEARGTGTGGPGVITGA